MNYKKIYFMKNLKIYLFFYQKIFKVSLNIIIKTINEGNNNTFSSYI